MNKAILFVALIFVAAFSACTNGGLVGDHTLSNQELLSATSDIAFSHDKQVKADFTIDNDKGKVLENETLLLTNNSTNAVSYYWDFGNGVSSSEAEPSYQYKMHGNYSITLTVTDASGKSHKSSQDILVLCIFGGGDHSK